MIKKRILTISIVAASLMCLSSLAHAQQKDWSWRLMPLYGWMSSISGDTGIGDRTKDIDVAFDDILENLEFTYMGHFEGMWRQKFGFFTDGIYVNVEADKTVRSVKITADLKQSIIEGGALYRVALGPTDLDFLAGVRYYGTDIDVSVGNIGDASKSVDWFDGIGGLRWQIHLTEKWSLVARGDLGFGGSNLSWNALGLVDWQPWEHFSFTAGYRALGIDYEDGDDPKKFTYDVVMQGPGIGFSILW